MEERDAKLERLEELGGELENLKEQFNKFDLKSNSTNDVEEIQQWTESFKTTIKQAEQLGVIEKGFWQGFWEKYENYTKKQWEEVSQTKFEDYLVEKEKFQELIEDNQEEVQTLNESINKIIESKQNRETEYAEYNEGKSIHPALAVATLGIPILLRFLAYKVAQAIDSIKLMKAESNVSSIKEETNKAELEINKLDKGREIRSLYGSVIENRAFFSPTKDPETPKKDDNPSLGLTPKK